MQSLPTHHHTCVSRARPGPAVICTLGALKFSINKEFL